MTLTDTPRRQPRSAVQARKSRLRAFRPDIEGLRAIAVLAVVFDHSGIAIHGGYVGVDIFYVISGFLITTHLYNELAASGRISLVQFYARRIRRILPAATVVILATLVAASEWIPAIDIRSVGLDAVTAALFCINVRIAETGVNYFANSSPSPFQQYWSLAIEEQFYALWPLLILIVTSTTRRLASSRRSVSVFLIVAIAASLVSSIALTKSSPSWAYFGLQTRVWELALGALIAINAERISRAIEWVAGPVSWLGLSAIVVAVLWFKATTPYPGIAVTLPVLGAALVIAAGCANPDRGAESLLRVPVLQYVGRISYSWYLWHWPVLIFLPALLGHPATTGEIVLALAASFVLASATYVLVEQPFRRNQKMILTPKIGFAIGIALIGISTLCAVLVMNLVAVPDATGVSAPETASVTRNIALAANLKDLPAKLSPALAAVPSASPYNCLASLSGGTLITGGGWTPTCTLGDTRAKRTVALFGDSHAWQWMLPLASIASKRGWRLVTLTKAACPIDVDSFRANDQLYAPSVTHCAEWLKAAFTRLSELRPSVVVMSSRTFAFVSPKQLNDTIARLKSEGAAIVWLTDTPTPRTDIPTCLSEHEEDIQHCNFPPYADKSERERSVALNEAAARDGAVVVDTVPWFCTVHICPAVISNTTVYFDNSHVSNAYALKLTKVLSTSLAGVMPRDESSH